MEKPLEEGFVAAPLDKHVPKVGLQPVKSN
jgi:hypothetical protein